MINYPISAPQANCPRQHAKLYGRREIRVFSGTQKTHATLQETCATLHETRAKLQETRGTLHETRATSQETCVTLQETRATLQERRAHYTNTCNITRNTCKITRNTWNITRNTCNITNNTRCSFWQPVQANSPPKSSGLVLGRRPLGAVQHSSNEPGFKTLAMAVP